jgi:hypothetical protein
MGGRLAGVRLRGGRLARVQLRGDGVRASRRTLRAMETVLAGLAATVIIIFVVPLAVLRAGVWRQERAASLTCRPRGLSAAIARRVFGLYACLPDRDDVPAAWTRSADGEPPLVPGRNGSGLS